MSCLCFSVALHLVPSVQTQWSTVIIFAIYQHRTQKAIRDYIYVCIRLVCIKECPCVDEAASFPALTDGYNKTFTLTRGQKPCIVW